jgi:ABC-type transporter Mla subunit MlaD
MFKPKSDRWIALSVILCSFLMMIILAIVLGKLQLHAPSHLIKVRFPSISGVQVNTPVRFAGAAAGHVGLVRVLPPAERLAPSGRVDFVEVEMLIPKNLELSSDLTVEIKQDGVMGSKYLALIPSHTGAPPLENGALLYGAPLVELMDLAAPAQKMLRDLQPIMAELEPTMANLNALTEKLQEDMPNVLARLESVLGSSDALLKDVSSEEGRARLENMLKELHVVMSNMKVVSTHAKALTSTLGEKPWRLLWGDRPNVLPTEAEIMASDKPLPGRKTSTKGEALR